LERVAKLIEGNPSYVHIEVQGHTDERGPKWFNVKLSEERAESVRQFLVSRGIEASRLSSRGFGAEKPLVERKSERAWFINRRVEFSITREAPSSTAAPQERGQP
jgi:outer membrane protein OmpA-like peptidoglycan-associated protein